MDLPAARLAGRRRPLSQSRRSSKPSILYFAYLRLRRRSSRPSCRIVSEVMTGSWRLLPRCTAAARRRWASSAAAPVTDPSARTRASHAPREPPPTEPGARPRRPPHSRLRAPEPSPPHYTRRRRRCRSARRARVCLRPLGRGSVTGAQGCSNRESSESRGAKKWRFAPNREAL